MNIVTKAGLAFLTMAAASAPAFAHHSYAMFDTSKTLTMKGVVKTFNWTNPHANVVVVSLPQGGKPALTWVFEMTSPGNLMRINWNKRVFKPGDRVEVQYQPLRTGEPGGKFMDATFTDTGAHTPSLEARQAYSQAPK